MIDIDAFDYMINKEQKTYSCDPWSGDPDLSNWRSVSKLKGQYEYKGNTFVVINCPGCRGMGGMDEGRPEVAHIVRVAK